MKITTRVAAGLAAALLTLTAAAACGSDDDPSTAASPGACPNGKVRFGIEPYEDPAKLKPAYDVLAGALQTKLGCPVELQIVDDYSAEVLAMRNGRLDLAQFGPLGFVFASQKAGAEPLVSFADGTGKLTSYTAGIWVPAGSPIKTIADLKGKSLALGSTGSTSGDALPRYALKQAGIAEQNLKLQYAGGHPEALLALTKGKVDAAEINSQQLATAKAAGQFEEAKYRRVWTSDPIPNDPIAISSKLDPAFKTRVAKALLELGPQNVAKVGAFLDVNPPGPLVAVTKDTYKPLFDLAVALNLTEKDVKVSLTIRGLSKIYGARTVLDNLDLDVAPGEFVAVLGANGSGKSTALRCVVGLETPDAGDITIGGTGRAAMVFQKIHLVGRRTALDNVCAGALGRLPLTRSLTPLLFPHSLRQEAMAHLHRVDLADRAAEKAARLSGGQQQRVAIARALCQHTGLLLADEPVSALDPNAADQVVALLRQLAADDGLAVVAVLHQPALARRYADRIVGLLHGRVALNAAPSAITTTDLDALYTTYAPEPAV